MTPKKIWLSRAGYIAVGFVLALTLPVGAKVINQDPIYQWLTVFAEALEHIEKITVNDYNRVHISNAIENIKNNQVE